MYFTNEKSTGIVSIVIVIFLYFYLFNIHEIID